MTHTFYQLHYHFVWSTKDRQPTILPSFQQRLYDYMSGIFKTKKCYPIIMGGVSDHVHLFVEIPPYLALAEIIRYVKVGASKWLHQNIQEAKTFEWQEGYGAFAVIPSIKDNVIEYIRNQETHHQKTSFKEEFIQLLEEHEVPYDPQFLWK